MKVVIDIPEPVPKLIKCAVGTSDHKPSLISKFHPAVVGNHVVVDCRSRFRVLINDQTTGVHQAECLGEYECDIAGSVHRAEKGCSGQKHPWSEER